MIRGQQGDRNRTGISQFLLCADASGVCECIADVAIDPRIILLNMQRDQLDQGLPKNAYSAKAYEDAEMVSLADFEMYYAGPDEPWRKKSALRIIQDRYLPVALGDTQGLSHQTYMSRTRKSSDRATDGAEGSARVQLSQIHLLAVIEVTRLCSGTGAKASVTP